MSDVNDEKTVTEDDEEPGTASESAAGEEPPEELPEPLAELDPLSIPETLMLEVWHETSALEPERLRQGFRTLSKRQPVLVEFVGQEARGLSESGQSQALFLLYLVYKSFVKFRKRAFSRIGRGKIEQAASRLQSALAALEQRRQTTDAGDGDDAVEAIEWIAERQPVVFSFVLHLLGEKDPEGSDLDREEADRIAMIVMHVLEALDGELRAA